MQKGVYTAVDFLKEAGEKEAFDLGGDVIVVGGGNVAMDVTRSAIAWGRRR